MSAEPSLQRPTVESDASVADAASGKNGSGGDNGGASGRSRPSRRGRRRRGRRAGRGNQQQQVPAEAAAAPAAESPLTPPTVPKPGGHRPGSQKPSGPKPGGQKPNSTKHGSSKGGPQRKGGGRNSGNKQNGNPKNNANNKAGANTAAVLDQDAAGSNSPASMPRTRRRAARRTEAAETAPRLHTVRETSSGGLVLSAIDAPFSELSAALIGRIDRRGRMMWSLPKGHIETGETAEQTAMREVAEETGIEGTIVAPLGKIDYWFVSEGKRIHKTVHHYLLRFTGGELSDADYEVSAVAWVPLAELPRRLTYSDERRLARMAESVIADLQSDPHRLAQSEASCLRTEPNDYEKAAAARNQRRNEPPPAPKSRRRRRRPRRTASGEG